MQTLLSVIASYGPWAWIVGGVILLAIELLVPGGVFVWLGVSAMLVGVLSLILPIDWPVAWGLFGVFSLATIWLWLKYSRHNSGEVSDSPFLNKRADKFIGREVVLKDAMASGYSRVQLDDTVWRVTGPDLPAGALVRIVGHDGPVLKVEAVTP